MRLKRPLGHRGGHGTHLHPQRHGPAALGGGDLLEPAGHPHHAGRQLALAGGQAKVRGEVRLQGNRRRRNDGLGTSAFYLPASASVGPVRHPRTECAEGRPSVVRVRGLRGLGGKTLAFPSGKMGLNSRGSDVDPFVLTMPSFIQTILSTLFTGVILAYVVATINIRIKHAATQEEALKARTSVVLKWLAWLCLVFAFVSFVTSIFRVAPLFSPLEGPATKAHLLATIGVAVQGFFFFVQLSSMVIQHLFGRKGRCDSGGARHSI